MKSVATISPVQHVDGQYFPRHLRILLVPPAEVAEDKSHRRGFFAGLRLNAEWSWDGDPPIDGTFRG